MWNVLFVIGGMLVFVFFLLYLQERSWEKEKKELINKIESNRFWVFHSSNPFVDSYYIEFIQIKDGYVQFYYLHKKYKRGGKDSYSINRFSLYFTPLPLKKQEAIKKIQERY